MDGEKVALSGLAPLSQTLSFSLKTQDKLALALEFIAGKRLDEL